MRAVLDGQRRLFDARRAARAGRKAQLRERIGQARKQIAGLQAQAASVEHQSGFVARELDAQRTLFAKGMTRLDRLLELEREAARLEGRAGEIEAKIAGARGRIAENVMQVDQIDTQRLEEAESRGQEVHLRENRVRERLASVRQRLGRLEVRAPVSGEVFGMSVFATREVVEPGEPILHIVPEDTDSTDPCARNDRAVRPRGGALVASRVALLARVGNECHVSHQAHSAVLPGPLARTGGPDGGGGVPVSSTAARSAAAACAASASVRA